MTEKTFVSDDGQVLRGEPVSITELLTDFRARLEQEAEAPLEDLELNAALMLSDLCRHLDLPAANHDQVLGERAVAFVLRVQEERPRLRLSPEMLVPPAGVQVRLN